MRERLYVNPDWYDDPTGLPFQRYWDGVRWTESTRPMPPGPWTGANATAPLPQFPVPAAAKSATQQPWYQRKGVLIPAAVVAFLIVIGAIGSAMSPTKKSPSADPAGHTRSQSFASPSAEPSTSAPSIPHADASISRVPAPKPDTSSPKPAKHHRTSDIGSFAMPNEVGQVLQAAQDDIQRVSGDPIFFSHSHDLLGDRFQILDRDWQVCTQNVETGSTVSAIGHIDFGVVKTYETCP